MARAMARGWAEPVLCSDSGSGRARALADEVRGRAADSNLQVAEGSDVVVLCHKPAQLASVAAEIAPSAKVVLSVLGGVSVAALQEAYPGTPVVRTMPNTPVAVRRGVVLYTPGDTVDAALEGQIVDLFERLGTVVRLEERHMAPATAVMGVGPAYQALLAEAQVDAAVRHGLPPAIAGRARRRHDERDGVAARRARLRHARSPARGDLAGWEYGAWARRPGTGRRARRVPGRHRQRHRLERELMLALALTRVDIANYVSALFTVYILLIFVYILVNLLFSFGMRTPYTRWTDAILAFLRDVCEPYLRLFRRFIPQIGMLDLSPMVAIIVLYFVRTLIVNAISG